MRFTVNYKPPALSATLPSVNLYFVRVIIGANQPSSCSSTLKRTANVWTREPAHISALVELCALFGLHSARENCTSYLEFGNFQDVSIFNLNTPKLELLSYRVQEIGELSMQNSDSSSSEQVPSCFTYCTVLTRWTWPPICRLEIWVSLHNTSDHDYSHCLVPSHSYLIRTTQSSALKPPVEGFQVKNALEIGNLLTSGITKLST